MISPAGGYSPPAGYFSFHLLTNYSPYDKINFDNGGNRLSKGSTNYTWTRGRLLSSVGTTTFQYGYNGIRIKKGNTKYFYNGNTLIAEKRNDGTLYYFYDASGICGFSYNGANYEYIKNIFGDIVGIVQEKTLLVRYEYDAWGTCHIKYGSNQAIATINPFRYRCYYYDTETGLYYLLSRYYDPEIGQFISPDIKSIESKKIGSLNLYSFSSSNPVRVFLDTQYTSSNVNLAVIQFQGNSINIHVDNKWLDTDWPQFFVGFGGGEYSTKNEFETSYGFKVVSWGLSVWKGSIYFDAQENHSVFFTLGNINTYLGADIKDGIGFSIGGSVASIGYDGKYLDASFDVLSVGYTWMWEDGKMRWRGGFGWFGFEIAIDFGQIWTDLFYIT